MPQVEPRPVTPGLMEARAARRGAADGLRDAIEREPLVRDVASQVQWHGTRNHFGDLFEVTLRRDPR